MKNVTTDSDMTNAARPREGEEDAHQRDKRQKVGDVKVASGKKTEHMIRRNFAEAMKKHIGETQSMARKRRLQAAETNGNQQKVSKRIMPT